MDKPIFILANGKKLYDPFAAAKKHPEHKRLAAEAIAHVCLAKKLKKILKLI